MEDEQDNSVEKELKDKIEEEAESQIWQQESEGIKEDLSSVECCKEGPS